MFVKLLSCTLNIFLIAKEYKSEARLLSLSHLEHNIVIFNAIIAKEVPNVLLSRLVWDASQLDTPVKVLLIEEIFQVDRLLIHLVITK